MPPSRREEYDNELRSLLGRREKLKIQLSLAEETYLTTKRRTLKLHDEVERLRARRAERDRRLSEAEPPGTPPRTPATLRPDPWVSSARVLVEDERLISASELVKRTAKVRKAETPLGGR
ncbi:hypothetical protein KIPB_006560, partial [Kipferlia bialata]|eukprot:g6560.t1